MATTRGEPWSRGELVAAIKLYCITPFGRIHSRNPSLIALAQSLGRTPSAIALKLTNFASLDPTIARAGMANYSKLDKIVWDDFFANMDAYLSENEKPQNLTGMNEQAAEFILPIRDGVDVRRLTKTRVNQDFFRSLVMASYDNKCALTGIDAPELLVASHIVPWSVDPASRTNPRNGICLNALHDRAFDEGLITIAEDLAVQYSPHLPPSTKAELVAFGQPKLRLPARFIPDRQFLDYHRTKVFMAT